MKILGYSERGILNSLLYEIRYADNGDALLDRLIDKATFPFTDKPPLGRATVLVEQSLSDFGDADTIILIESDAKKCAIFVEAKVQAGAKEWLLSEQFERFENGLSSKVDSSNIFTQIYHKQVFMKYSIDELKCGVKFPPCSFKVGSKKTKRKIGNNPVVLDAAKQIKEPCDTAFYLLLVPDNDQRVAEFFACTLRDARLQEVPEWDTLHYGYLTWSTVEAFCEQNQLNDTLDVFKYNGCQIYRKP